MVVNTKENRTTAPVLKDTIRIQNQLLTATLSYVERTKVGIQWKVKLSYDGRQFTVPYESYGTREPTLMVILIYLVTACDKYYQYESQSNRRTPSHNPYIEASYGETIARHAKIARNVERLFGNDFAYFFTKIKKMNMRNQSKNI